MKRTLGEWRRRSKLSQEELGKAVGLSRPTIARYENEGFATATFETVMKTIEVLGIELDQLEMEGD